MKSTTLGKSVGSLLKQLLGGSNSIFTEVVVYFPLLAIQYRALGFTLHRVGEFKQEFKPGEPWLNFPCYKSSPE